MDIEDVKRKDSLNVFESKPITVAVQDGKVKEKQADKVSEEEDGSDKDENQEGLLAEINASFSSKLLQDKKLSVPDLIKNA